MAAPNLSGEVLAAVSSTLQGLAEQRKLEYSRSCIKLVDSVETKFPLSELIMKECTGDRKDGRLEGPGSALFNNGSSYKGAFKQGLMHGQGVYTWRDGLLYQGEFTNCTVSGVGSYLWPDGSSYEGEVTDGLRHGSGVFRCSASGVVYTGQWVKGKREGHGRLDYGPGSYYKGHWLANRMEGQGLRKYSSGNVYDGSWVNNKRHGVGRMNWADRGEEYTGDWVEGVQCGHGEHTWGLQGHHAQYPVCNRYVGEWKDGVRHGQGTFYYASGAVYQGSWVNNKKEGQGKFLFTSGKVYVGSFNNDQMVQKAVRPQTPLGSLIGDMDSREGLTESFNLEVAKVLPPDSEHHYKLKQVHCVLLRYITQLKAIYHQYSSIGTSTQAPLTRLQLWRMFKDCQLHHHGFTLHHLDLLIEPKSRDPDTAFLVREFLQALVFVAAHMMSGEPAGPGKLSRQLESLILSHILPLAGSPQGPLFGGSSEQIITALTYKDQLLKVYQKLYNQGSPGVTVRDVLLLLKDCRLITESLPAKTIMKLLSQDDPLIGSEGDYNTTIQMVFLEFYEAILLCALAQQESLGVEVFLNIVSTQEQ